MPTGLTRDAGWQIGVSRTLPHPPPVVWDLVGGPGGPALWLGPGARLTPERGTSYRTADGVTGEVRGYRHGERIRVTRGSTTVQVTVSPAAGGTGTVLRFHEERLRSAQERESRRVHWKGVVDEIARLLGRAPLRSGGTPPAAPAGAGRVHPIGGSPARRPYRAQG